MDKYVFKYKTRIYTNVHSEELNVDKLAFNIRKTLFDLLKEFHKTLSEDNFIEGILSGGAFLDLKYPFGSELNRVVIPKLLSKLETRLLLKLFQSPRHLIRRVGCVISKDGELCIDLDTAIQLNEKYLEGFCLASIPDKEEFSRSRNFLNAIFNTMSAAKHLLLTRVVGILETMHGVGVDSTCDISEVEYVDTKIGFERREFKIVEEKTEKFEKVWDIYTDKVL